MESIQIITTPNEFKKEIVNDVKTYLDDFLKNFRPIPQKEYLSRNDVAKMLGVDISTISNWQKSGKLNPLAISGRIYFLRSEVEASIKPINV
jgi:DNA-binding transcriptional regulator YiaG